MHLHCNILAYRTGGARIKVAVRIRPLMDNEKFQGHEATKLQVRNKNEIQ